MVLLVLAGLAQLMGCGGECRVLLSGGLVVTCAEAPPGPNDPAFGAAAEILIGEGGADADGRSERLWIGVQAPEVYAEFEALRCAGGLSWIGGSVVVANDHPHGFFFDPGTVLVAEVTAEAMQTTIDQISADPRVYAPGGGGGLGRWVVPADVLAIETAGAAQCAAP